MKTTRTIRRNKYFIEILNIFNIIFITLLLFHSWLTRTGVELEAPPPQKKNSMCCGAARL